MRLDTSIDSIPGVGGQSAKKLERLGLVSIGDLLHFYPRYHVDLSQICSLDSLGSEYTQTLRVVVYTFSNIRLKARGKTMQKAVVGDNTGKIEVVWFNQPFLEDIVIPGEEILLAGKLNIKSKKPQILSPDYEKISDSKNPTHLARISPVYALTEGIRQKWLRARIVWLIEKIEYIADLNDTLNPKIKSKYHLIDLKQALQQIHFPKTQQELEEAKYRFGFEEMLDIQIRLEEQRRQRTGRKAIDIHKKIINSSLKELMPTLPFVPTQDQSDAIQQVVEDIQQTKPMYRLLQGDVGSGKTLVAIVAAKAAVDAGIDVAVMAPTTVLASQLCQNFETFLKEFDIEIHLYTSSTKKNGLPDRKNNSKGRILIGTHSLLYLPADYLSNVGLVVIDEQHRFGVEQRKKLYEMNNGEKYPHYLLMTATPIPRTLAMSIFGDLDLSFIKTKPKGRKPIKTFVVPPQKRSKSYKWLSDKIKTEQAQVFWICPLIEDSDIDASTKSVNYIESELKKHMPQNVRIRSLHGQLKEAQKSEILTSFRAREFDILVSTSVIEVGIDIPNANYMVIEGAERFGMAQLHQLRGRVGRGTEEGYCFLYLSDETSTTNSDSQARLEYFCRESDGLKIAEYDLERRGPGEVYGSVQSGVPNLRFARLTDRNLIEKTREAAREVLS